MRKGYYEHYQDSIKSYMKAITLRATTQPEQTQQEVNNELGNIKGLMKRGVITVSEAMRLLLNVEVQYL